MPILTEPVVSMYREADSKSETVSQAKMGEPVQILDENTSAKFYHIKTLWDNYTGFVRKECVDKVRDSWKPDLEILTSSLTNLVYSEPKVQAPLLAKLPLGISLSLQNTLNTDPSQNLWLNVELPSGVKGFIQKGDICYPSQFKFTEISTLRKSLVDWANKFLGAVTYLWGGTSSFGIDCSGFVQHIYRLHNLPLERDASQQGQGKYIDNIKRKDVLPGDLIFFEGYKHVGMAISHFSFIHATTDQKPVVQVSDIDSLHWLEKTIQYSRYKL